MKRVIYAGTEVVTGDDIASTLLRLGESLARVGSAGTVDIPVVNADGSRGIATVLIGPASQIVTIPVETAEDELVDEVAVGQLEARIESLNGSADHKDDTPPHMTWLDDF